MYMYECIYRIHVCVNVCVRARARVWYGRLYNCASVSTLVHRGVYGCPDAHTHTRIRGPICVWRQPYPRACAYGWIYKYMRVSMARHRRACIGMHVYVYICNDVYIPMIHLLCT
jgi:hypothetical protein